MKFASVTRIVCVFALFALQARAGDFALKDGDRVVFYGDSITDQRLYTTFTETYVVTRFPKLDVSFVHSGWGGDRVSGGGGGSIDVRLRRDVFAYKPTVMTIMLGMNDGSYRAFDEKIFDTYAKGYQRMIDAVKRELPGIRITVIQPSPYDDVTQTPKFEGGYNGVLARYGQFVKELAGREKLGVADLNAPVVAALEKAKASDAELAKKIIPDRVHPGASGHLLMAAELLKSWQAPAMVSAVEIDARAKKVADAKGTSVSELKAGDAISWTQLDEALPMPVDLKDPVIALAVASSDFVETLNQQTLKVKGLSAGNYTLKIDDDEIGSFTGEQLSQGINLTILPTPMVKQAAQVHKLTLQHNNIHFQRWRQVQVPLEKNESARVQKAVKDLMTALDDEEAEIVKQQRAAAQPKRHQFQLVRK
ncbi:MAG: SGNH/GDSL hydrolase family protein [Verrucomicrobia subdivision 3 bacterium]|nr:SGNH/GDSL hydrolase family protein [Limisphaerales bacterium]